MRRTLFLASAAFLILLSVSCRSQQSGTQEFITVRDGQFYTGGKPYRYIGTNLWYGGILGSNGQGGNRQRLCEELDELCRLGVTNLRVLVGGEGLSEQPDHIRPMLQPRPGEYNDTLLAGLDFLMAEMGKRHMRAVLYLHNAWQWSGGYGTYLQWAGEGEPAPASVWNAYTAHHSKFVRSDSARHMALRHTQFIVSRINSVTGRPYRDDPTLMAWEICNEPRPFARDSETKAAFLSWIGEQARAIKQIDPNHLVTTGSEGKYGCEVDMELFRRVHALPEIDYLCIHIWPFTWNWIGRFASPSAEAKKANPPSVVVDRVDDACRETKAYLDEHLSVARALNKPLVLEEFGYPRDNFEISPTAAGGDLQSPTTGRDRYYEFVLSQVGTQTGLSGCNFWAWGGRARVRPLSEGPKDRAGFWLPWDDYTGDPAQEEQGLYSVFSTDATTKRIIKQAAEACLNP
ncbi:MAG: cellulase family glycosylhydrolase [Bacteroidaceae bacterium]|nr:cellulase family glycosylhydrolase [Bacteroidaceae bacterium]MBR1789891.1 cellulase family glycosylhydrolase [Bacteroidaceae bacterium]